MVLCVTKSNTDHIFRMSQFQVSDPSIDCRMFMWIYLIT